MLVSIFIPTYNSAGSIEKTINSLLSQTYKNIEICIVDDCSTDETIYILEKLSAKEPKIRYIQKEKNGGFVPDSWNRVLPMLRGEFTIYMSHDDMLSDDCIERLVSTQQATNADCVIPEVVFCYDNFDNIKTEAELSEVTPRVLSPKEAFAQMLNYDIPGFALWRTSLIKKVGMPIDAWNADEGMQRIWALNSNKVVIDKRAKFYYLILSSSITKGLKPYHLSGLKTQQRLLKNVLTNCICFLFPKQTVNFIIQYIKSYLYLKRKIHI